MKDFEYYSNPTAEYYPNIKEYKQKMIDEINQSKMTAVERELALAELPKLVREHRIAVNKPYQEEKAKLTDEFWKDAREELGYEKILNKEGVQALESMAWEDEHAHGFASVFARLEELTDFVKVLVKNVQEVES